jgi:hypothetical protein
MKKKLSIAALLFTAIVANATNGNDNSRFSESTKQNSTFFKMSRNSNRLAIFQQLQGSVKLKSGRSVFTANPNQTAITQNSNYNDIIELFGEPNVKIKNTSVIYTLNPTSGCKAVIEFDANQEVVYIAIKDCN